MDKASALHALGAALREIRLERSLSQEELANRCDLHRTYIGGIERGERNLSYTALLRVAEGLSVRPEDWVALACGRRPNR